MSEKRMKGKPCHLGGEETCFFYTVQQQISHLSASSVLSFSVRLGLDQIRRCDQTWRGFSGIAITITLTRAAHCVIWCQIAETSDWQPRRDTDWGGQKVEPGSTSLAWKAEGSQRRGVSLWRWCKTLHFRRCAGFGLNQPNTGVVVRVRDQVFATVRCKRNKIKQVSSPPRWRGPAFIPFFCSCVQRSIWHQLRVDPCAQFRERQKKE